MQISLIGFVLAAENPTRSARWFEQHFGFKVGVDIGWYVHLQSEGHPNVSLDFVQRDHESWPVAARGKQVTGSLLALLVDDVDAEHERLSRAGVTIVLPLITEPWGQRRFQVAGPDGLFVEVLQRVEPDPAWLAAHGLAAS
ncbi:Glyoxalase-like domain-containing protein [Nannocystis exedens]|uniref:Glyoxalase-like domain-containing protein n=1 Tax=Nannocystis exedens TaxID=54 RepID=A0A1I1Y3J6_9BACT|nr:VOC family protein [Nannocystis exedens]PCC71718.1 Glyoxalase-like domain protein [Nannocystis exedens]SFE12653.1 Glyoxalase-like domain-containing protein [Nannocystis exedens]